MTRYFTVILILDSKVRRANQSREIPLAMWVRGEKCFFQQRGNMKQLLTEPSTLCVEQKVRKRADGALGYLLLRICCFSEGWKSCPLSFLLSAAVDQTVRLDLLFIIFPL